MNPTTESSTVNEPTDNNQSNEAEGSSSDRRLIPRLVRTLVLFAALISSVIFGLYKMRVEIPALKTPKIYAFLDATGVRADQLKARIIGQNESSSHKQTEEAQNEEHKITVTSPLAKDVTITQDYVCLIRVGRTWARAPDSFRNSRTSTSTRSFTP